MIVEAKWVGPGGQHTWLETGMNIMCDSAGDKRAIELLKADMLSAKNINPGDYRIVYNNKEIVCQ